MTGTNGSQLWDAAFIAQALCESGLASRPDHAASTRRLLEWLDACQIRDNPPHYREAFRHRTEGAWPFSTREQGYTVSDCTAEGMKSVLLLQELPCVLDFPPPPSLLLPFSRPAQAPDPVHTAPPHQAPPDARPARQAVRLGRHDPEPAEPRGRVRVVRAHPREPAPRTAQPGRGLCQHHDRVPLCRVHDGM